MGIRRWARDRAIRSELEKLERKYPMIRKTINWLTDPAVPGRKRTIAVVAALVAGALRGVKTALVSLCERALFEAETFWCQANPDAWALWLETANEVVQTVLIPGADLVTVIFGTAGILHARAKAKLAAGKV